MQSYNSYGKTQHKMIEKIVKKSYHTDYQKQKSHKIKLVAYKHK